MLFKILFTSKTRKVERASEKDFFNECDLKAIEGIIEINTFQLNGEPMQNILYFVYFTSRQMND